jgi:valyl-tRNA synthetase
VSGYQGKLSNAGYMAKAPPNVVQETQKMLLDAQAELQMVERSLRELT